MVKFTETYPMVLRVPESLALRAQAFAQSVPSDKITTTQTPPSSEIKTESEKQFVSGEERPEMYYKLVTSLTTLVGSGKL